MRFSTPLTKKCKDATSIFVGYGKFFNNSLQTERGGGDDMLVLTKGDPHKIQEIVLERKEKSLPYWVGTFIRCKCRRSFVLEERDNVQSMGADNGARLDVVNCPDCESANFIRPKGACLEVGSGEQC